MKDLVGRLARTGVVWSELGEIASKYFRRSYGLENM